MKIHKEVKKIAVLSSKLVKLINQLSNEIDTDGCDWQNATFIDGCTEKGGHLYKDGRRLDNGDYTFDDADDYYCCQYSVDYCEDCYYGTLYFKVDVPGQFVAVPFYR